MTFKNIFSTFFYLKSTINATKTLILEFYYAFGIALAKHSNTTNRLKINALK